MPDIPRLIPPRQSSDSARAFDLADALKGIAVAASRQSCPAERIRAVSTSAINADLEGRLVNTAKFFTYATKMWTRYSKMFHVKHS
jgi:hypothetical protein